MKGYKNLIDSNSLHNHSSIVCLTQKKQQFQKLFATLRSLQNDVNINANQIRNALQQTVDKTNSFVSNFLVQINDYLDKAQEITLVNPQYKCFCDFMTNDLLAYVAHKKNHRKQKQLNWNSSHFITLFNNAIPYNPLHFNLFLNCSSRQDQLNSQLNQQRSKPSINQNQYTKIKSKVQESSIEKDKQMVKSPHVGSKNCSGFIRKTQNISHFYCGQCKKQSQSFRNYVVHLRKHDFIIHPESSHIVLRKAGRKSQPLKIQGSNSQEQNQKFICPCKLSMTYERKQFISHVLKWHKGIAPRK